MTTSSILSDLVDQTTTGGWSKKDVRGYPFFLGGGGLEDFFPEITFIFIAPPQKKKNKKKKNPDKIPGRKIFSKNL